MNLFIPDCWKILYLILCTTIELRLYNFAIFNDLKVNFDLGLDNLSIYFWYVTLKSLFVLNYCDYIRTLILLTVSYVSTKLIKAMCLNFLLKLRTKTLCNIRALKVTFSLVNWAGLYLFAYTRGVVDL